MSGNVYMHASVVEDECSKVGAALVLALVLAQALVLRLVLALVGQLTGAAQSTQENKSNAC